MTRKTSLATLDKRFFRATGFSLTSLIKAAAILLVVGIGIGWTLLSTGAEHAKTAEVASGESKPLTDEEKFRDVSMIPGYFHEKRPVERLSILNSKIETAEELVSSGGEYTDKSSETLLFLYGTRCRLEESEGIDAEKSYRRLAELRQAAVASGDKKSVATADFLRAIAATSRLTQRTELADFRFAADVILNLDSNNLVNTVETRKLFVDAINLHSTSKDQESTAIYLDLLADKLIGSPESSISDLGLNLKDYPRYYRFHKAGEKIPHSTPEARLKFYEEMFAIVEKNPPLSPNTYRIIIVLLDSLINKSEIQSASDLTKRLAKAASTLRPEIQAKVDQSIKNIESRIAILGETLDLSGSAANGRPLKLPNGKPTTLIFWRPTDANSTDHLVLLADSEWLDPWETNVLVACSSKISERQLKSFGRQLPNFTVLDNETALRLTVDIGIDLVPYHVSLNQEGKVIRLGSGKN